MSVLFRASPKGLFFALLLASSAGAALFASPAAAFSGCKWEGPRFIFGSTTKWPRTIHVIAGQPCTQRFTQMPAQDRFTGRQIERYKNMTLDTDPAHGSVALHDNASFDYIPAKNYRGSDAFNLTVCNGADLCSTVAYSVSIE